jgi:hypothetical protein
MNYRAALFISGLATQYNILGYVARATVPELWGVPPGECCWSFGRGGGARVVCMRDIFIWNKI